MNRDEIVLVALVLLHANPELDFEDALKDAVEFIAMVDSACEQVH
jgi:hypothetical protein